MKKAAAVPDAWDDDWETQVDGAATQQQPDDALPRPSKPQSVTGTERFIQHAEANRRLWESADALPQTFHYLEANSSIPLTSPFKPQVKVLSRNPVVARDPVTGISVFAADENGDSDKKEAQLSPEQIRAKQRRDRDERQKRYDEARAKIFGESAPSSRGSSPGTVASPRLEGRHHTAPGRGRGRGGGSRNGTDSRQQQTDMRRQNNPTGTARELYDPNVASKPDPAAHKRGADGDPGKSSPPQDEPQQPIRMPWGPDSSGRGGAGFVWRGVKGSWNADDPTK